MSISSWYSWLLSWYYPTSDSKQVLGVARTIYEDSSNEGENGMQAIAEVIRNRINHAAFATPHDAYEVVTQPQQFQGYVGDAAPSQLEAKPWKTCLKLGRSLMANNSSAGTNLTQGAHYFQKSSPQLPFMTSGWIVKSTVQIGSLCFFKLIPEEEQHSSAEAEASESAISIPESVDDSSFYVCANPEAYAGAFVGDSQESVSLIQAACSAPEPSLWKIGKIVKGSADIPFCAPIATFEGPNKSYEGHAAIYKSRNSEGIVVIDQWVDHPAQERLIRFGGSGGVAHDGDKFHLIRYETQQQGGFATFLSYFLPSRLINAYSGQQQPR